MTTVTAVFALSVLAVLAVLGTAVTARRVGTVPPVLTAAQSMQILVFAAIYVALLVTVSMEHGDYVLLDWPVRVLTGLITFNLMRALGRTGRTLPAVTPAHLATVCVMNTVILGLIITIIIGIITV